MKMKANTAFSMYLLLCVGYLNALANHPISTYVSEFGSHRSENRSISSIKDSTFYHSVCLQFSDFTISVPTKLKLNAFVNGNEINTLSEIVLDPNTKKTIIKFKTTIRNFKGVGEFTFDKLGAMPIVISNDLDTIVVSKTNLQNYSTVGADKEQIALGNFLTIYKGYENMLGHYNNILVSPYGSFTSDTTAYDRFFRDYVSFRKQFNAFFDFAKINYPNTYISHTLSKIFVQDLAYTNLSEARDNYFKSWNLKDPSILNNPIFNRQFDIFYFMADFPAIKNNNKNIDAIFNYSMVETAGVNKLVADHITQLVLIKNFEANKTGENDQTLQYLHDNWLSRSVENCNEEASSDVFRKAFYKRLGNISNMQVGKKMPEISGFTQAYSHIKSFDLFKVSNKPFSIVFVWSSSCSHCESFAPLLQQLADQYPTKVQVLAYSIDKENNETEWKKNIAKRKKTQNWVDIAEISDNQSNGISNICYMGTPSLFLINKNGEIISKEININTIKNFLESITI